MQLRDCQRASQRAHPESWVIQRCKAPALCAPLLGRPATVQPFVLTTSTAEHAFTATPQAKTS